MAEVITCPTCGVCYSVPDVWLTARRESHAAFYCPNGHTASYKKETDAERLERECYELHKQIETLITDKAVKVGEIETLKETLARRNKRK